MSILFGLICFNWIFFAPSERLMLENIPKNVLFLCLGLSEVYIGSYYWRYGWLWVTTLMRGTESGSSSWTSAFNCWAFSQPSKWLFLKTKIPFRKKKMCRQICDSIAGPSSSSKDCQSFQIPWISNLII